MKSKSKRNYSWLGKGLPRALVRATCLCLLIAGLAACTPGQAAQQKQGTQTPTVPKPTCGHVQIGGGRQVPLNGPEAQQAENCFARAFQQCRPASLSVTWMGIDSGINRTFINTKNGFTCSITDVAQTYVIPTRSNIRHTYTCTGLTRKQGGLLFTSCGADGNLFVPPAKTAPGPQTTITLTPANANQTIKLKSGDTVQLVLGTNFDWTVQIANPAIVSRVVHATLRPGVQGIYKAAKPGQTTLSATGDPTCRKAHPACGAPSLSFHIGLVVR